MKIYFLELINGGLLINGRVSLKLRFGMNGLRRKILQFINSLRWFNLDSNSIVHFPKEEIWYTLCLNMWTYYWWLFHRGRQLRKNKPTWYFVNLQYQKWYQLSILSTQNAKIDITSISCQMKKSKFNINSISYQLETFYR